jgi:O-acetylserine/cysteine efflux transporter
LKHFLLALAVVAVWGTNFVVIKLALGQMPPLLFATLRFAVVVVPAVFFLPRPAVGWGNLAALSWAGGNLVSRAAGRINMVAYVVWSSLFAVPPLFALSLWAEGWPALQAGVQQADLSAWAAVVWQAVGNSLFGYAAWGWLLARHSAATITPLALLVPLFGMGGSALWLGEPLPMWKLIAAGLVLSGLGLNLLWPLWLRRRLSKPIL